MALQILDIVIFPTPSNKRCGFNVLNTKFLYYFMQTKVKVSKVKASIMWSMLQIKLKDTDDIMASIIDFTQQQKIVELLDKFDKLTTDISEGIPAEIKMRHQQYVNFLNLRNWIVRQHEL